MVNFGYFFGYFFTLRIERSLIFLDIPTRFLALPDARLIFLEIPNLGYSKEWTSRTTSHSSAHVNNQAIHFAHRSRGLGVQRLIHARKIARSYPVGVHDFNVFTSDYHNFEPAETTYKLLYPVSLIDKSMP